MKKIGIRIGILSVVFVVAVLVLGYFINKESVNITADIPEAILPKVSFQSGETTINTLRGYVREMDITTMRDTLTPVSNHKVRMNIIKTKENVEAFTYELLTLDGTQVLFSQKQDATKEEVYLEFDEEIALNIERVLKITLHTKGDTDVYYYTRVLDSENTNIGACLGFAREFHEKAQDKAESESLQTYLETGGAANNATLQLVTIHSSLANVTWGDLEPKIVGEVRYDIKELNTVFAAIQLTYQVSCVGEENESEIYNVTEFFRVRDDGINMRLLDYNRTLNQVFDAEKNFLNAKGILLGIASLDVEYMQNTEGNIVSFVREGALWNYDKETAEISRVFDMGATRQGSTQYLQEEYDIKVISVEEDGSTTFVVLGYMSNGIHEGESGFALYHFDSQKNAVEEKIFINTRQSYSMLKKDTEQMLYYSCKNDIVYALLDGVLYEIELQTDKKNSLVENIQAGEYVASQDGHIFAYQIQPNEIAVLNLATGEQYSVVANEGERILPLSFVGNDIIYGYVKQNAKGMTISGEETTPMYKIEISDEKQKLQKTYEESDIFVTDIFVENGFITLNRVVREGELYRPIAQHYITDNKEKDTGNISLQTYETERKKTQVQLVYANGIGNHHVKLLQPKQLVFKEMLSMTAMDSDRTGKYYVYAYGALQGVYTKASYALQNANLLSGVALTANQEYIWERRDHSAGYSNPEIDVFTLQADETALEGCVRKIAEYVGETVDTTSKIRNGESTIDILSEITNGEGLDLSGCQVEEVFYLVSKGYPVIGMFDADKAVLIIEYGKNSVTYLDPQSGGRNRVSIQEMNDLLSGSENTLIGYVQSFF
jgi:hypothetical protein